MGTKWPSRFKVALVNVIGSKEAAARERDRAALVILRQVLERSNKKGT
jgi:hypothetical protein